MDNQMQLYKTIYGFKKTNCNYQSNNKLINQKKSMLADYVYEKDNQKDQLNQQEIILVIDRFEENIAVCENRESQEIMNIDASFLPETIEEGDVIRYKNGKFVKDENEKNIIQERINNKMKDLFND